MEVLLAVNYFHKKLDRRCLKGSEYASEKYQIDKFQRLFRSVIFVNTEYLQRFTHLIPMFHFYTPKNVISTLGLQ